MTTTSISKVVFLSLLDTCDRCPAQAQVLLTTPTGKQLMFCKHDYDTHADGLAFSGCTVTDDRRAALA
jgi:hypothetical protein